MWGFEFEAVNTNPNIVIPLWYEKNSISVKKTLHNTKKSPMNDLKLTGRTDCGRFQFVASTVILEF